MKESTTYQAILQEGEVKGKIDEARKLLLKLGAKRFGEPDAPCMARINSINSLNELEDLIDRMYLISNWSDLLK